ncbi:MAG TPA: guanine deaminase, partial [Acinetobacter radioresistens]|nr:guanine deaminase [Acinetobacter radioresistens]
AQPTDLAHQVRYLEDGLLITEQGKIVWFGPWQEGQTQLPAGILVEHYPEQLIVPGFIDTHIHYPQSEMVGAYGEQLLSWLNT